MKRTLTEQQKKTLSVLAIVIFVLLSAALAWFVGRPMVRFARQPEQFRAWVDGHGAWGPLAYAAMVFLQVLVAIIPGEPLEIAGGYAFGAWAGTALCLLGAVLGSVTVFALVRRWGRGLVEVFFPADKLEKLQFLLHTSPKRTALFWLIFTVPGTPKDLLCYFAGLTDLAVGDLAADCHSGPPALHRHLHRGRQRPGGAELPGGGHCLHSCPRCGGCGLCDLPRRLPSARTKTG